MASVAELDAPPLAPSGFVTGDFMSRVSYRGLRETNASN